MSTIRGPWPGSGGAPDPADGATPGLDPGPVDGGSPGGSDPGEADGAGPGPADGAGSGRRAGSGPGPAGSAAPAGDAGSGDGTDPESSRGSTSAGPWWAERGSTRPLAVDGGLRARSQRGAIGRSWWSARFLRVLEDIGVGGRLGRGRSYARTGQVISLQVAAGSVLAEVQGSRPRPYNARIGLPTFGKTEWARVEQAMADSAWYAAKLLAGEMPEDVEDVFGAVGLALFPGGAGELSLDCDCPDHQVPCKHLAAVFYLLAESFDDDPFGMLALRGRDRQTLLANIRTRRPATPLTPPTPPRADPGHTLPADPDPAHTGPPATGAPLAGGAADGDSVAATGGDSVAATDSESVALPVGGAPALDDCLDTYFQPGGPLPALVAPATRADAVLDQVPPVRLTVGGRELVELLRPVYRAMTDQE